MRKGERSLEDECRKRTFAERLEEKARNALSVPGRQTGRWSPKSIIEDEVALVLHQIDTSRERERDTLDSLLNEECGIGTELLQMEARTPRYSPYRFPEREKLQRRLGQLSQERRRFSIFQGEKLDGLHNRLLALLGRRRLLSFNP